MTRLTEEWIHTMADELPAWQEKMERICQTGLLNLVASAGDVSRGRVKSASWRVKVGIVPITAGLGLITSFCQDVAAIVHLLGFEAFVTEATDVAGFYEATQRGAAIIFLADDDYFLAINVVKNQTAENSDATARGFVAALEFAAGGLRDKEVLVLGGGRVGGEALQRLKQCGAQGVLYDTDKKLTRRLAKEGVTILKDPGEMKNYPLIVDATPQADWITADMLHPGVIMAAPGVPLSVDAETAALLGDRLIHDLLPTGVLTMLAMTC